MVRCRTYSAGVYLSAVLYGSQLGADYFVYRRLDNACTVYQNEKRVADDDREYADYAHE